MKKTYGQGFTLIELLLVVAIISILLVVVSIAVDIPRRLAETNDVRRESDIRNIINAVHAYTIDHKGALPAGLASGEKQLGNSVSGCVNLNRGCNVVADACLDMSETLKDYLRVMPKDPKVGSGAKTWYTISVDSKNLVTVKACGSEGTDELIIAL